MKIKPDHYAHLRDAISPWVPQLIQHHANLSARKQAGDNSVKDVSKRVRWDALYAAKLSVWVCDTLYPYMDDTHVDTALRSIMRELGVQP